MTIYAVGDVQGCYDPLRRLLDALEFDPVADAVWFAGDLVNRGPDSAKVLRFIRELDTAAVAVLGNHDLHLLAVAAGAPRRDRDSFHDVLDAPDRDELLAWLRSRPLAHHDAHAGWLLIHAGLAPQWDLKTTLKCAGELETYLRGPKWKRFLNKMYGDKPARWDSSLSGHARRRFICNTLTRLRYVHPDRRLALNASGPPGTQPRGCVPWFRFPDRASADLPVAFGHWSTLGALDEPRLVSLDTGCVWGGQLSAVPLMPRGARLTVPCKAAAKPGH